MIKKKPKIIYDKESGVLVIEIKNSKSVDSDISGNAVVDYDSEGNMVRINLYNFNFDMFRNARNTLKSFTKKSGFSFRQE